MCQSRDSNYLEINFHENKIVVCQIRKVNTTLYDFNVFKIRWIDEMMMTRMTMTTTILMLGGCVCIAIIYIIMMRRTASTTK